MRKEAISPAVPTTYIGLECPATGELCPTRLNIAQQCDPDYSEDMSAEVLALTDNDSRAQTFLLGAHNQLINLFGCELSEVSDQCPPSVKANERPGVSGLKRLISKFLVKI